MATSTNLRKRGEPRSMSNGKCHELPDASTHMKTRYEIVRTLGRGGTGEVVVVRKKDVRGRAPLYAMKIARKALYRRYEKNPELLGAIRDPQCTRQRKDDKNIERRALVRLPWNPFIAGIVDAFEDRRNYYQVLELGYGTLNGLLHKRSRPFRTEECRFYFINLVLAVEFLHSHQIVHRDIKPDNVLFSADGYLMLTDFGNSQHFNSENAWDEMGTLHYLAPECIRKDVRREHVTAIDWWSLACMLFEMATGQMAFPLYEPCDETSVEDLREKILRAKYNWPEDVKVDPKLRDLVERMLVANVEERIASVTTEDPSLRKDRNEDLRKHPFLHDTNWEDINRRRLTAPYIPTIPESDPAGTWFNMGVPSQKEVPGLSISRAPITQTYDVRAQPRRPSSRRDDQLRKLYPKFGT